mgnify:CR=1 FL=1
MNVKRFISEIREDKVIGRSLFAGIALLAIAAVVLWQLVMIDARAQAINVHAGLNMKIAASRVDTYLDNYQQQIDAEVYHDVVIDYRLGEDAKTSITLGLTNITDEAPPYLDQGFNANTDPSTYRMFGSSYYLRLKHGF